MTDPGLAEAWAELHAATPAGWYVGRPGQRHGGQWAIYAFDTTERVAIGKRSREWTAVGQTEVECIRELTRCLREIAAGRVPGLAAASATIARNVSVVIDSRG